MIQDYTPEYLSQCDERAAKAAERYQDYVHQKKLFESLCKDMLAALALEIKIKLPEASQAEIDMRARASEEWKTFRDAQIEQLREAGKRWIQFENAVRRWETSRSGLSTRKKELERIGG